MCPMIDDVFSYRITKDGRVFISWHGRQVTTLKGREAAKFAASIESLDAEQAQLLMARLTGNFKRGNERVAQD